MADVTSGDEHLRHAEVPPPQARVFISYRHEDSPADTQLLYERLTNRFGSENVFLDRPNLQAGMKWRDEIKSHIDSCDVLLALIGPRWMSIMWERGQENNVEPAEDWVRSEIERALRPDSGITVIPVLFRDSPPLKPGSLPRSLRALAGLQKADVRPELYDRDIEVLIARIEAIARERATPAPDAVAPRSDGGRLMAMPTAWRGGAPPPDEAHCEDVLQQMVDEGNLVPFLGSWMPPGAGKAGGPPLPDTEQLAAALARRFGMKQARLELPEIAQHVYATRGAPDLYIALRQLLTGPGRKPGPVHRFLARFPRTLEELGLEKRYQLIVSTSLDTALEQAFDDESEPYDLVVYMASNPHRGKFVHFPAYDAPRPIDHPNSYTGLPFWDDYELRRTVIVKIHGAVDGNEDGYRWEENYVITEDHYIDYLSESPITSLVPTQVLAKLRQSHCLFLGYPVRDWSLRVFLKRIWGEKIAANSWAVAPDPDVLETKLWSRSNVGLYAADLGDYVDLLHERLSSRVPRISGP